MLEVFNKYIKKKSEIMLCVIFSFMMGACSAEASLASVNGFILDQCPDSKTECNALCLAITGNECATPSYKNGYNKTSIKAAINHAMEKTGGKVITICKAKLPTKDYKPEDRTDCQNALKAELDKLLTISETAPEPKPNVSISAETTGNSTYVAAPQVASDNAQFSDLVQKVDNLINRVGDLETTKVNLSDYDKRINELASTIGTMKINPQSESNPFKWFVVFIIVSAIIYFFWSRREKKDLETYQPNTRHTNHSNSPQSPLTQIKINISELERKVDHLNDKPSLSQYEISQLIDNKISALQTEIQQLRQFIRAANLQKNTQQQPPQLTTEISKTLPTSSEPRAFQSERGFTINEEILTQIVNPYLHEEEKTFGSKVKELISSEIKQRSVETFTVNYRDDQFLDGAEKYWKVIEISLQNKIFVFVKSGAKASSDRFFQLFDGATLEATVDKMTKCAILENGVVKRKGQVTPKTY
jgi:hypothetical protein